MKPAWTILLTMLLTAPVLSAPPEPPPQTQPAETRPSGEPAKSESVIKGLIENASRTRHEVTIAGRAVAYDATAANMLMKDETGKLKATVFFVAYEATRPQGAQPWERPVTFVFNGGPGAAAVWLHLGTAGPYRILLEHEGHVPPPPSRLVPNEWSWLDATDMVFIDPVGTGYSRPAEGEKGEQFYGVKEDIRWVAEFIRLYTTQYERWLSPKFLAGESYGTTRAAGLSEHLLDRFGIALNGIMLISSVLDFQTLQAGNANELPYVLYVPTYAATAAYHGRLAPELQQDLQRTLREVERWSMTEYMLALAMGSRLQGERRESVVQTLARYTALSPEFISKSNLRIRPGMFQKQLLGERSTIIGRFDSRITGYDPEPAASYPPYDPAFTQYLAIYSATFNDYARRTLGFQSLLPYEVLSDRVRPWKYGEAGQGYLSVADNLSAAMTKNPHVKVLFASGYFDLATPYFATDYTIDHLDISPELRRNIVHQHYPGGHMMYHYQPALEKLHGDVTSFIRSATPPTGPDGPAR